MKAQRILAPTPRRVATVVGAGVVGLLAAHLVFAVGSAVTGHPLYYLPRLFDLGQEANVPTYASALLLLLAALLLAAVTVAVRRQGGRHVWAWGGLALGFALMSVDESAQIHDELVGAVLYRVMDADLLDGHYTWYFAYIPLLVGLALVYIPFLRSLSGRYLRLFVTAGVVYVGGAVGIELFEASLASSGASPVALLLSKAVEETAELSGVVLLIYAVLEYLRDLGVSVSARVGGGVLDPRDGVAV